MLGLDKMAVKGKCTLATPNAYCCSCINGPKAPTAALSSLANMQLRRRRKTAPRGFRLRRKRAQLPVRSAVNELIETNLESSKINILRHHQLLSPRRRRQRAVEHFLRDCALP